jgi:hypothetical protein
MLGGTPVRLLAAIVAAMLVAGALSFGSTVSARTIKSPARSIVQAQSPAHAVTAGHKKKKKANGPTAGQLQKALVSDAHKTFGTPTAKSASCVMPSK